MHANYKQMDNALIKFKLYSKQYTPFMQRFLVLEVLHHLLHKLQRNFLSFNSSTRVLWLNLYNEIERGTSID